MYAPVLNHATDLATAQTVSVRFPPTAAGPATGAVASAGGPTRTVVLTGTGVDPTQTVYSFAGCTGSSGSTALRLHTGERGGAPGVELHRVWLRPQGARRHHDLPQRGANQRLRQWSQFVQ